MLRVVFCGFMENVRDSGSLIRFPRLMAARHCSGIGEEHSLVGA